MIFGSPHQVESLGKTYTLEEMVVSTVSPKLSVIVPCHNMESWLPRCMDSMLNQTFVDLEFILIDDGSSDGTAGIIREYAASDDRVVPIFLDSNHGCSATKNTGIDAARGDWMTFADPDDYADRDLYAALLDAAERTGADIVMGGARWIWPGGRVRLDGKNFVSRQLAEKISLCPNGALWDKIVKSNVVNTNCIRFPLGRRLEDNLFLIQILYYSDIMACIDSPHYNYIQNSSGFSLSRDDAEQRISDARFVVEQMLRFGQDQGFDPQAMKRLLEFTDARLVGAGAKHPSTNASPP